MCVCMRACMRVPLNVAYAGFTFMSGRNATSKNSALEITKNDVILVQINLLYHYIYG